MNPTPDGLAVAVVCASTLGITIWLSRVGKIYHCLSVAVAGIALLFTSVFIAWLMEFESADIWLTFTLRDPKDALFIEGYIWFEYGILFGSILAAVFILFRRALKRVQS